VYIFFKGLSPERLQYIEGYYAEQAPEHQFWEVDGYRLQRRCPHLKADLTRFGKIENGILTCTMHGWQFELATGKCLTSDDRRLFSQRITKEEVSNDGLNGSESSPSGEVEQVITQDAMSKTATMKCKHCWYLPTKEAQTNKKRAK
jgi:UDP-MurNAc hydroxylase